eukprot:3609949-Amphidinium_carterae.1
MRWNTVLHNAASGGMGLLAAFITPGSSAVNSYRSHAMHANSPLGRVSLSASAFMRLENCIIQYYPLSATLCPTRLGVEEKFLYGVLHVFHVMSWPGLDVNRSGRVPGDVKLFALNACSNTSAHHHDLAVYTKNTPTLHICAKRSQASAQPTLLKMNECDDSSRCERSRYNFWRKWQGANALLRRQGACLFLPLSISLLWQTPIHMVWLSMAASARVRMNSRHAFAAASAAQ